jgi:outer membrane protein W
MLVGDYYFNKGTSFFAPFIGAGLGAFNYFEFNLFGPNSYSANTIGGAIRGGFELYKIRLALEYYLIPSTVTYNGGIAPNSYLTVNIGLYLGGGKWRK